VPPLSLSSAIASNITVWAAITSPTQAATPPMAMLAAARYNFRRLLAWLRFLLLRILIALGLAAQLKLA